MVGISLAQAQQIILNLALNSRDAMPSGGRLKFESHFREVEGTGPVKRFFEFSVSDTGQGMDNRTASHAFEPFFTTKSPGHGTGTGLATVREIVERADGIVLVETRLAKAHK